MSKTVLEHIEKLKSEYKAVMQQIRLNAKRLKMNDHQKHLLRIYFQDGTMVFSAIKELKLILESELASHET